MYPFATNPIAPCALEFSHDNNRSDREMSRQAIQQALDADDSTAELIDMGLQALRIIDPGEVVRMTAMLNEARAYYNDGVRGASTMDKFFEQSESLEVAIDAVARGFGATGPDIESFIGVMDATSMIEADEAVIEDFYAEDLGDDASNDDNGDDSGIIDIDSSAEISTDDGDDAGASEEVFDAGNW
jgi:hypothetical protein